MRRRTVIAGVPTALLFSGCTDLLTEDEVRFEADTAVVADDVESDSSYDEVEVRDDEIKREFKEVDKTVVVVNSMAEYARSVDLGFVGGELSRFTALATPKIDIVPGRPANPVGNMDNDELAEMVQKEYDDVSNIEQVDTRDVEFLGSTEEVTKYSAEARTESGESVEVYIHVGQTDNEDDFVLAIGVHPQEIDDEPEIDGLIGGIEHPA